MYFVYILYSQRKNKTYVGQTHDIENRLKEHNSGKVKSTKPYMPFKMIYNEKHETRQEALLREKFFKSSSGRKQIKIILKAEMAELVDALDSKSSEAQTS